MKTIKIKRVSIILFLTVIIFTSGYAQNSADVKKQTPESVQKQVQKYKVTFIELGSVKCIPCQKMQPVMKSIEEKYKNQVQVVFHDVWTPLGKPFADQYAIKVIPTQVFLDENGKEYFRHEGFFPEEDLIKVLKQKGVK